MCVCMQIYIYIYIHIDTERERERERETHTYSLSHVVFKEMVARIPEVQAYYERAELSNPGGALHYEVFKCYTIRTLYYCHC